MTNPIWGYNTEQQARDVGRGANIALRRHPDSVDGRQSLSYASQNDLSLFVVPEGALFYYGITASVSHPDGNAENDENDESASKFFVEMKEVHQTNYTEIEEYDPVPVFPSVFYTGCAVEGEIVAAVTIGDKRMAIGSAPSWRWAFLTESLDTGGEARCNLYGPEDTPMNIFVNARDVFGVEKLIPSGQGVGIQWNDVSHEFVFVQVPCIN